jgi:GntR family transcriptional regulator, transcriptional repressor for pyruvate dehydrogenase complex
MSQDPLLERLLDLTREAGPGQRIPAERELAEDWGVSRTALRSRLRMLESVGALERRGAAGSFVRVMEPSDVALALTIGLSGSAMASPRAFEPVRIALERQAAKQAAENMSPVPVAYVEEAVLRMEATTDPELLHRADLEFHRALFSATGDPALIFFSDAVADMIAASVGERRRRMDQLTSDVEEIRSIHRHIFEAVKLRDPLAAMAAVDEHFDSIARVAAAATERAASDS